MFGGIFGGGLVIGLVACIGGFLHARRNQLQLHEERMKALELGRELPDDPATAQIKAAQQSEAIEAETPKGSPSKPSSPAAKCYSTTSYACGTGFVFAWLAQSNQGVAIAIAAATGAVGVTGMICGTILAAKAREPEPDPFMVAKPRYDPEGV
jgi:hypothetical protein